MDATIFILPNGLRFVHRRTLSPVAHCGLHINTGTRDEQLAENGIVHLIEHMFFKGTSKRSAYHINNRLENVGGELNAFTTKEETVLHATVLKSDIEKAIELIADMAFRSTFPEKELVKEKEVIIDEINSYKDNPSELIFDDFDELLFAASPLGRPILGTAESLKNILPDHIKTFTAQHYRTSQMVFSTIGKFSPKRIEQLINKHFGEFENTHANNKLRQLPPAYKIFQVEKERNTFQAHCVMGNRAYSFNDKKRIGLALLTNYLGGPAANSRLNTLLREKHGLVYTIEANYTPYCDCGSATIYFGTDKGNLDQCFDLINKELTLVCTKLFGTAQLHRIKKQLLGQLSISSDNAESQMLSQGKSLTVYNSVETFEQLKAKIDALSAMELQEIANEIFSKDKLSTLIYK